MERSGIAYQFSPSGITEREWFSTIFQKVTQRGADVLTGCPISDNSQQWSLSATLLMKVREMSVGHVGYVPAVFPKTPTPIDIFKVEKKSLIHSTDLFYGTAT